MQGSSSLFQKVHKRCTWLNANVFWDGAIDEAAILALSKIDARRAMEMCQEVETKADTVANPSGYLVNAVRREGMGVGGRGDAFASDYAYSGQARGDPRFHKRCAWLNMNVFWHGAIDDDAIAALSTIDYGRAMEMLKDIEEKASTLASPSGYLKNSIRREMRGRGARPYDYDDYYYDEGSMRADNRIHRRCTWLNANIFWQGAIDEQAIRDLSSIDPLRAMAMLREVEAKADQVSNPNGYLKNAVRRENLYESGGYAGGYDDAYASGSGAYYDYGTKMNSTIHKRCTWLNANVFWDGAIDEDAIAQLSTLDTVRAMEMLKELEGKSDKVINPSGYLKNAVSREDEAWDWDEDAEGAAGEIDRRVQKRCTWLNANVFGAGAIDKEAMASLSTLDFGRAMEICRGLEEKGARYVANPSRYLKVAVRNEELPRPDAQAKAKAKAKEKAKAKAKASAGKQDARSELKWVAVSGS
mmetsp:Transcript_74453/g.206777  ORF Transcript_74453/g.206777 Transcript_74453/m.206777 type:complete len:471 (-) Transcript_74453:154-1566(-)